MAHYGKAAIRDAEVSYRICDKYGKTYTEGTLYNGDVALGNNIGLGSVMVSLDKIDVPRQMVFEVMLKGTYDLDGRKEEVRSRNHWDFWVYPQTTLDDLACMDTGDVYITDTLDKQAEEVLKAGGKVLVAAAERLLMERTSCNSSRPCSGTRVGSRCVRPTPPGFTSKATIRSSGTSPRITTATCSGGTW